VALRPVSGELRIFVADAETPLVRIPLEVRDPNATRALDEASRPFGVRISPQEVYFGEFQTGTAMEVGVFISRAMPRGPAHGPAAAPEAPLEVYELRAEPEDVFEAAVEPLGAFNAVKVAVRAKPGRPGPISGRLLVGLRPGKPPVALPISGLALPRLALSPPALFVAPGSEAAILLTRRDGEPFKVVSAEDRTGRLEVEATALEPRGVRILARPRAGAPPGDFRGEVVLVTDVPGEEQTAVAAFGSIGP